MTVAFNQTAFKVITLNNLNKIFFCKQFILIRMRKLLVYLIKRTLFACLNFLSCFYSLQYRKITWRQTRVN